MGWPWSHVHERHLLKIYFFRGTGAWTQGFKATKQVLYHLSHTPGPFLALAIFQIQSCIFAWGWPWTEVFLPMPPWVAGFTIVNHHTQLIGWDGGLTNLLPRLTLNYNLLNLSFSSSKDYMHEPAALELISVFCVNHFTYHYVLTFCHVVACSFHLPLCSHVLSCSIMYENSIPF
jgi:hypothetical protein